MRLILTLYTVMLKFTWTIYLFSQSPFLSIYLHIAHPRVQNISGLCAVLSLLMLSNNLIECLRMALCILIYTSKTEKLNHRNPPYLDQHFPEPRDGQPETRRGGWCTKDGVTINSRRHFPISLCLCVKFNFCWCARFHWLWLTALTAPEGERVWREGGFTQIFLWLKCKHTCQPTYNSNIMCNRITVTSKICFSSLKKFFKKWSLLF